MAVGRCLLWSASLCHLIVLASAGAVISLERALVDPEGTFQQWSVKHGRSYVPRDTEYHYRFGIWKDSVKYAVEKNAQGKLHTLGLNGFSDMTRDEFRQAYLGQRAAAGPELYRPNANQELPYRYAYKKVPSHMDWAAKGVVGPVKNQHANNTPCGCCWAFAAIGVVECINAMYTGTIVSLSEQELIDCDKAGPWYDEGCEGGDFFGGMVYIIKNGGIDTEDDYPYTGEDGTCAVQKNSRKAVTIDAAEHVPSYNETALMQAVAQHPVGVGVCVGDDWLDDWHAYTGGIWDEAGCDDVTLIDHGMVVVGYGEEHGMDYWLLKNSWGADWGEQGFMKLKRNIPNTVGHCCIAYQPAYPIKTSANPEAPVPFSWPASIMTDN